MFKNNSSPIHPLLSFYPHARHTQGPIQGTDLDMGDQFGMGLKLDSAGKTLLIGAPAYGLYSQVRSLFLKGPLAFSFFFFLFFFSKCSDG